MAPMWSSTRERDVIEMVQSYRRRWRGRIIRCCWAPQTLQTAVDATARSGTVVNIAIWSAPVQFDLNTLVMTEVNLLGVLAYANEHAARSN
jgi:threonine dehydrogenase-like Zn-dependent dehydrogenase